jgi:hypothetical protein
MPGPGYVDIITSTLEAPLGQNDPDQSGKRRTNHENNGKEENIEKQAFSSDSATVG